ncbi:hypothetical protein [Roseobacter cerasinus]|nr:hypothetical protein [Roseobacter cerasinus]
MTAHIDFQCFFSAPVKSPHPLNVSAPVPSRRSAGLATGQDGGENTPDGAILRFDQSGAVIFDLFFNWAHFALLSLHSAGDGSVFGYEPMTGGLPYVAFIGDLPMKFTSPSPMKVHKAADAWRHAELAKIARAKAAKVARLEAARKAREERKTDA